MKPEQKDEKLGQAYQVIASLMEFVELDGQSEKTRALDYFAGDDFDPDFLPWPRLEKAP